ncbi:hypothetical protein ACFL7M_09035 [Thermodesulfobacteriota bacterium]
MGSDRVPVLFTTVNLPLRMSSLDYYTAINEKKISLTALADHDVAPYGYKDFFDAAQIFCSNHVLGLDIGNVDQSYPLFGIPTLCFE